MPKVTKRPVKPFLSHLYLRVWLAVLAAVIILTLLVAMAWSINRNDEEGDQIERTLILRNASGMEILEAPLVPMQDRDNGMVFEVTLNDNVQNEDVIYMQLPPRPPPLARWVNPHWFNPASFFLWVLAFMCAAVALGTYPIVRRLTRRLESLQRSVEKWGAGDLSTRVPVQGGDEVADLAKRFNEAAARIETLVNSHKTLLANASHELRSPIARIRMGLELGGAGNTQSRDEITHSLMELDQLIEEILLASRLDAPQAGIGEAQEIDFTGLVAEECARVGADLEAQAVSVMGNAKLLRRLVRNLLENARRYSTGEIEVALHTRMTAPDSAKQEVVLEVSDHGPGVPPELREKIFEPFYRKPGASEHDGGVGLGLALVKSIAKHHGATVTCKARLDGLAGACFICLLPANVA